MKLFSTITLSLALIISSYFIAGGIKYFNRAEKKIFVRGLAEREIDANIAVWKISFTTSSNKIEDVKRDLPLIQASIQEFLTQKGFKEAETIKGSSIADRQAKEYGAEKGNRFIATGFYQIKTDNVNLVEKSEQEIDELLKKGILITGNQKNYYFTELNKIKPAMLDEAAKNAREAAVGLAQSMNVSVGKVRAATQGVFSVENPLGSEGGDSLDSSSIKKKVRVVTQVEFEIN